MARRLVAAAFVLVAGGFIVCDQIRNPDALPSGIMERVGQAAALGQTPDKKTLDDVHRLAIERPLNWEPFAVQGAMALRNDDYARAERLIVSARQRAPRSPAARFLLAEIYLGSGRPTEAMTEMAVLNRLVPSATEQLAPALADYARMVPDAVPQIRKTLASYPELETPLLAKLSWDPKNADLILALAGRKRTAGPPPDWQRLMLTTLVNSGEYDKAYAIWRRLADVPDMRGGFYNPTFADRSAPAPFNWELAQGAGGVAEARGGGLQVLYFGRDNVPLAGQVLLLPRGRYRLEAKLSGNIDTDAGIAWTAVCLGTQRSILSLPLTGPGAISGDFVVPNDCTAQRIMLAAEAPDVPNSSDFLVTGLQLTRVNP